MSRRSVVWITLESIRADHTTIGGYERETTTELQRLAEREDATTFADCHAHGIYTRASTGSILTGLPPTVHGAWDEQSAVDPTVRTLPEAFRAAGYRTVGISPNPQFSEATGLDRGFSAFHLLTKDRLAKEVPTRALVEYLVGLRRHSAGYTTDTQRHSIGYLSNELAKSHLRRASETGIPVFLYQHLGDTHHAYYPPKAWQDRFEDELPMPLDEALSLSLDLSKNLHRYIAGGVPFSERELQAIKLVYDTHLAYVDSLVGELVDTAEAVLDDPLVVVTSDHGELFGEERLLAHMLTTHSAVTHVPAVVAGVDGPDRYDGVSQHADLMSVVADACGVDHPIPAGQNVFDAAREIAVTQFSGRRASEKIDAFTEYVPDFDRDRFQTCDVTSARTETHRYERGADAHLFALEDGDERRVDDDELAAWFEERLDEWEQSVGAPGDRVDAQFSDAMRSQLADLGYL